jgi:mono/diheme cytochrome c family protein
MKIAPLVLMAGVIAGFSQASARSTPDDMDATAKAGKMFETNCSACHQVPDLSFEVDRAWLTQVADTA